MSVLGSTIRLMKLDSFVPIWRCLLAAVCLCLHLGPLTAEIAPKTSWATRAGGIGLDSAHAIAADAGGNLYVAGVFTGTAQFGSTSLIATVGFDLFLAKLSPTGAWLWAKNIESGVPGIERFLLLVDSTGNPILATTIAGDAVGDGLNVLFLAKFNSAGVLAWSKKFKPGGLSSAIAGGMAVDAPGNIYLTGTFGNQVDFGGGPLTDTGGGDIFVAKYGSNGVFLAARRFGGSSGLLDEGRGIALQSNGTVNLLVTFQGVMTSGAATLQSAGGTDVALIRLDASLNPFTTIQLGGAGDDVAEGLTRDTSDRLAILGRFSEETMLGTTRVTPDVAGHLIVARSDPTGFVQWVRPLGPSSVSVSGSRGFLADVSGNLFLSTGGRLIKLNSTGVVVWEKDVSPSFGVGEMNGLAVQAGVQLFVAGGFSDAIALDALQVTSAGLKDALVLKLLIDLTPPPVILVPPKPQKLPLGGSATFTVSATGAGPLHYQWFHGTLPIAGANSASLVLTNLTFLHQGVYNVVVSNAGGPTPSVTAQLEVFIPPPTILLPPQPLTVDVGQEARFRVEAKGYEPLLYQWQLRGTNLPGAITSLLVLRNLTTNEAGPYSVVVGNPGGYSTSSVALLKVRIAPPVITSQPQSISMPEGATAAFDVQSTGSSPLQFQWQRNGVPMPGKTSSRLTLTGVTDADVAMYRVLVSNGAGSILSAEASLSIQSISLFGEPFDVSMVLPARCGDALQHVAVDDSNQLYFLNGQPHMEVPGLTNGTTCGRGLALAKLSSQGVGIWRNSAQMFGAGASVSLEALQVDATQHAVVLGNYAAGSLNFGFVGGVGATLPQNGAPALFLLKFQTNGPVMWNRRVIGAQGRHMMRVRSGGFFIAGSLSGTVAFGTTNVVTPASRLFVAKTDDDGSFLWVKCSGPNSVGTSGAQAQRIFVDTTGDVWLAGIFWGKFEYGAQVLTSTNPPPNTLSPRRALFLARHDGTTGNLKWVRKYQCEQSMENVVGLGPSPDGGGIFACEIAGRFFEPPVDVGAGSYGAIVCRVGPEGAPANAFFSERKPQSCVINASGEVLLGTKGDGETTYGGILLKPANGQIHAMLLKLDPDLKPQWARDVTGLKHLELAMPTGVVLTDSGDAWMHGFFNSTNVVFGPLLTRVSRLGGNFLAKVSGPAAQTPPSIASSISNGKLQLRWPLIAGWQLQTTRLMGESFIPFNTALTTNMVDGTVSVVLPLDAGASFYRLFKP